LAGKQEESAWMCLPAFFQCICFLATMWVREKMIWYPGNVPSDRIITSFIRREEKSMAQAKDGDTVKIHYTGTLDDGTVFDSSEGREPLQFTLGSGQVIAGFEEAVRGMDSGEKKKVTIPADKAYGQRNEEMIIQAPRDQVPPDINPEVGQQLQMAGPDGQTIIVQVTEVTDDHITLDANPPLAGKDLTFDIELVGIE
jgi:peptidylprolyl isomerase